ncbi:hypothetical protein [Trichothermofontia sp.]
MTLFLIQAQQQGQAKKQQAALLETDLPQLWILASAITQPQLTGLGAIAQPDWPTGVYHLPSLLRTAMIDPKTIRLCSLSRAELLDRFQAQ